MSDTKVYRLPDLLAFFPRRPPYNQVVNPNFSDIENSFNDEAVGKFGAELAAKAKKCDAALFVAAIYPLASYKKLRGIVDFTASAFVIDDVIDRCPTLQEAEAVIASWLDILRDAESETKSPQHPFVRTLHRELLPSIKKVFDPWHWSRFLDAVENMTTEMAVEAYGREKNVAPTVKSILESRRLTSGVLPFCVILQSTCSLYIPDNVIAHPLVKDLVIAITDICAITNDIYSFKKELAFDEAFGNILIAIKRDPELAHLDFQGVLDHSGELVRAAVERVEACIRDLPSFGPEIDGYLSLYTDSLMDMAIGNVHWSAVCRRYAIFENDEDRKRNVVSFLGQS